MEAVYPPTKPTKVLLSEVLFLLSGFFEYLWAKKKNAPCLVEIAPTKAPKGCLLYIYIESQRLSIGIHRGKPRLVGGCDPTSGFGWVW
jgi:hypothetical protein